MTLFLIEIGAMAARPPFSLRLRVLAAIALVVIPGALAGAMFAGWQARQTLRGGAVGRDGRRAPNGVAGAGARPAELTPLIATFDGNRHVVASLIDAHGRAVSASTRLRQGQAAPSWFLALMDPRLGRSGSPRQTGRAWC